jgi:hypothetical protein
MPITTRNKMIRSEKQILITGCYRTGTEYITQLLNNHPKLSATMYTVSFMRFSFNRYNPIEKKANYKKLLEENSKRIQERWNKKLNVKKILDFCENQDKVTYALLYDLIISDLYLSEDVRQWAEKTQLVWTKIPDFLKMFPKGKAILVIRDPRSVLASFKKFTYAPEPAYLGAIFNCFSSMKLGLDFKEKYSNRFYIVRYEDIARYPEETLIKIFDFLELKSNHDLLSEEGWVDAKGNSWGHNSAFVKSKKIIKKFDKKSAIDRWKKNLSNNEIALCEYIIGDLFDKYNYTLSNIKVEWSEMIKPVFLDEKLMNYFKKWILYDEGVEEFPTDPLKPENWSENVKN